MCCWNNFLSISSLAPGTKPPTPLHSLHSGEDVLASYIRSFYPTSPLWVQTPQLTNHFTCLSSGWPVYLNQTLLFSLHPHSLRALQLVSSPSKLTPPFPQIFSQSLCAQGFLQSQPPPPGCKHISISLCSFCSLKQLFFNLDLMVL